MLRIRPEHIKQIIEHARREHPLECCGCLVGKDNEALKVYEMSNVDKSRTTYLMDPIAQLQVYKQMEKEVTEIVGIYHSHPPSEAFPSPTDLKKVFYEDVYYLIVSLSDWDRPTVRVFKLIDSKIKEEEMVEIG
ncbi:[CysO sulfur-carrier protein]-S-L-cysteine hydrolase [Candidatus Hakubella thermalkaliphila]|uniref:[CysO sulfur-carrier protein]-S-L-cysteine hydrolase n=2 Tax=Candidatus Hakubella thermalkaliphila TaxID=2754717 RepID=A0A6V8P988_9ACTN|nr:[CysO sulfur-carrier protein]-S-L-cysteine hydrolase [Candidatus Hakubella thermalkaliphila]